MISIPIWQIPSEETDEVKQASCKRPCMYDCIYMKCPKKANLQRQRID